MPAPKQRMLQLQFTLDSGVRILRQLPTDTSAADLLNAETEMCAHLGAVLGRPPTVTDRTCNEVWRRALRRESLHFTNLCGRIQHAGQMRSVRPHMRMLFVHKQNNFGHFLQLSHLDANFVTSQGRTTTLFRAGRSSERVYALIEQVFDAASVSDVHLHMCVCAAHLGKPVRVTAGFHDLLDEQFLHDPLLQARLDYSNEEMSAVKVIAVEKIDTAFLDRMLPDTAARPRQVLVHIGSLGFVNMFAVMQAETTLVAGMERHMMPLFEYLLQKIDRVT